jgi:hypothetical protein
MIIDILTVLFFVLGFFLILWMIGQRRRDVLYGPYVTKKSRRAVHKRRRAGEAPRKHLTLIQWIGPSGNSIEGGTGVQRLNVMLWHREARR